MTLTPTTNTYLLVGDELERQVLYFTTRPVFSFPTVEERRGNQIVLQSSKYAVWQPLMIEVPTRTMPRMTRWMRDREILPIHLVVLNKEGQALEDWYINNAQIVGNIETTNGRQASVPIHRMSVSFNWANRVR